MITKNTHGPVETFKYRDLPAIQVWGVMDAFTKLGEMKDFYAIIELGTDYGGLTNALADNIVSKNADIHTFDINGSRFKNYHSDKITFHNIDYLQNWDKVIGIAVRYLGPVLFLCDGGNKKAEYEKLSQHLAYGDCIMVHDYFPNREAFNANDGRWNWWEFDDDHTQYAGLVKSVDFFDNYAWFFRERM